MNFGITKNLAITALIFGCGFTFLYGWFNSFVRPMLGALGMFADAAIMGGFFLLFVVVYTKVLKRPVGA